MSKINFNKDDYINFDDYNNLMIQAFGIGCSLCYEKQISFVFKNSPIPVGKLIKSQKRDLTDLEIEKLIEQPIKEWQNFEDKNFENNIPTFLCDECWNEMI